MFTSFVHVCLVVVSVTIQFPSKSSNTHVHAQGEVPQPLEYNEIRYPTCLDKRYDIRITSLVLSCVTRIYMPRLTNVACNLHHNKISCRVYDTRIPSTSSLTRVIENAGQPNMYTHAHQHQHTRGHRATTGSNPNSVTTS